MSKETQAQVAKPGPKEEQTSWQERMISRFSGKSDQHRYLTELPEITVHEELYKTPHLRSLYSTSFTNVMNEARNFCQEVAQLKVGDMQSRLAAQGNKKLNQSLHEQTLYQMAANQQSEAERCYVGQLNKYIEQVTGLGQRYNQCKNQCLDKDPEMARELQKRKENQTQSTEYFNPIYTNTCLTECRSQFYFTFKRVSKYFGVEGRGFYIESSLENLQ